MKPRRPETPMPAKPTAEPMQIHDVPKEKGVRYGHIKNLFESNGMRIIQSNVESFGHGIYKWTITAEEKESGK